MFRRFFMRKYYINSYITCLLLYMILALNNQKEDVRINKINDEYFKK